MKPIYRALNSVRIFSAFLFLLLQICHKIAKRLSSKKSASARTKPCTSTSTAKARTLPSSSTVTWKHSVTWALSRSPPTSELMLFLPVFHFTSFWSFSLRCFASSCDVVASFCFFHLALIEPWATVSLSFSLCLFLSLSQSVCLCLPVCLSLIK